MRKILPLSLAQQAVVELSDAHQCFQRSTTNLTEELSGFRPASSMMTTAQQVAHVARVIDWLIEGAFRPEGFDMNFEEQIRKVTAVHSVASARAWLEKSVTDAIETLCAKSDADLSAALPAGTVMGGMPRMAIVHALVDHTAHHRGALTVYARLNGIAPPDPYGM